MAYVTYCKICGEKVFFDEDDIKYTVKGQPYITCPSCGMSRFIKRELLHNPNNELEDTIDKYTEFQHKKPDKIIRTKRPKYPRTLAKLGSVEAIIYKKDSDGVSYIHEFDDMPILLTDKKGENLYILGNNIKVKDVGITG